ncbi:hypothetical protein BFJ63_vAg16175 [Fusarium oxysporum f. sp. narcissi]|uniref:NWD NACHT-NTPase N-terminal domain-containing protein n=2 Tax=Fusarium oxysporum TaxID=5507 RepID=A0A4Q2V2S5_FUSOX|nr:hypothetical protein Forpi1262_v015481 [Fusarium oxysporum f. sp. raphani]RYC80934.1 hypothetical protein BFJ63_vAg16175 [Fusarium oxysporum f. sp. narcissi]
MKDTLRRLKGRVHEGLENFRNKSDQSLVAEGQASSVQVKADTRQPDTRIPLQDRAKVEADAQCDFSPAANSDTNRNATNPPTINNTDVSNWGNFWPEAYENIQTDPEHSGLLEKLEISRERRRRHGDSYVLSVNTDDPFAETPNSRRLKTIQKNAEERLKSFSEAHLSFKIRDQPIVVRESVLKAVQVINTLKPIIIGAVAAEPSAALAWAGVATILPILENIFQQDEDAATGLTNVIFLMARYQGFHERDFISHLQSSCQSASSRELLSRIRDDLVSVYGKIYIYEARFIIQYGRRNKLHRAFRNALNADGWKQSWSEIESIGQRFDKGVNSEVNVTTLKTWKAVKDVQEQVERLETMQHDFDRRQLLQSL